MNRTAVTMAMIHHGIHSHSADIAWPVVAVCGMLLAFGAFVAWCASRNG